MKMLWEMDEECRAGVMRMEVKERVGGDRRQREIDEVCDTLQSQK